MTKNNKRLIKLVTRYRQLHVKNGFTLVELMVVIAILGIIAVIAIPNFAAMHHRARSRASAMEIAQDFRQIRERSLALGQVFEVRPVGGNNRIYEVVDPDGNVTTYKLSLSGGGGGIKFGTTNAPIPAPEGYGPPPANGFDFGVLTSLLFLARGAATQGAVYITNGNDDYAIGVNRLGKTTVYLYDVTAGRWGAL